MKRLNSLYDKPKKWKQHCKDDLYCQYCCSCSLNHQKVCEEKLKKNKDEINKMKIQNKQLLNMNLKIQQQLLKLKKKQMQYEDIDEIKKLIKEALKKQVRQQDIAEKLIMEETFRTMQSEVKKQRQKSRVLIEQNLKYQQIITQLENINDINKLKINKLMIQNQQNLIKIRQIEVIKKKNQQLFQILKQKTTNIDKIIATLGQAQKNYEHEKLRAQENEFQNKKHKANLKQCHKEINLMSTASEISRKSINMLRVETDQLNQIVIKMNQELVTQDMNKKILNSELQYTEEMFRAKSHQLQLLKYDVEVIKRIV